MIAWFARNHVAANLLMLSILVGGALSFFTIRRELIPAVSLEQVRISIPYPGATPAEVESGILLRVEEAISDLEGIKELTATATEGVGVVVAEVRDGYDTRRVLDDVKVRIDGISTFPEDAEEPVIEEAVIRELVINLALSGSGDLHDLRARAEQVREELLDRAGISQVELAAIPAYEISVTIDETTMRRYGLTLAEIEAAIRRHSLDLPAGSIQDLGGDVLLRSVGQAYRGPAFADIVVRADADGRRLTIGDLGRVVDGFADVDLWSRFDGDRAAILEVYRIGDQDVVDVSAQVHDYLQTIELPPGWRLTPYNDRSEFFKQRLDTLGSNGLGGLVLVLIALTLFLRLRLALWVSVGLVVSFAGAFLVMPMADASVNMISLFAFILVLGIVVDDAIVVSEAIYDEQEHGHPGIAGAIRGAGRVARPVLFAVLTTVIAFAPLLFVSGPSGRFYRLIPIVVIACLLFSLIESLLVLPAHLRHGKPPRRERRTWLERVQDRITGWLQWGITRGYRPLLRSALRWRYATGACFLAALATAGAWLLFGHLPFTPFPSIAADFIVAKVDLPEGVHPSRTAATLQKMEDSLEQVRQEIVGADGPPLFRFVRTSLGYQPGGGGGRGPMGGGPGGAGGHLGEINVELLNLEPYDLTPRGIANRWRAALGELPGIESLTFETDLSGRGQELNWRIAADDRATLEEAVDAFRRRVAQRDGVLAVTDSLAGGKQELSLRLLPQAAHLGVTLADVAQQVRYAFYGAEAQRVQRGRNDVRVMVRYPEDRRDELASLYDLRVTTPAGAQVPITQLVTFDYAIGDTSITRVDRRRVAEMAVELESDRAARSTVKTTIQEEIIPELFPAGGATQITPSGRDQDQKENLADLRQGFLVAILAMYALLAVAFGSYTQPILLMAAIPFGIVGAIVGHQILGKEFSMLSIFGVVALAGVVVNDNLVLVDAVNRLREAGRSLREAVVEAGSWRFRPILLTTMTTFLGLTPLLAETSVQAQFLIPMALSLAAGVVFATVITLIFVPCLYVMLEDVQHLFQRLGRALLPNDDDA